MDIEQSFNFIGRWTYNLLIHWGISKSVTKYLNAFILAFLTVALIYVVHYLIRRILRITLIRLIKSTKVPFFHHLLENRFAHYLALMAPIILINLAIPVVFIDFPRFIRPFSALTDVYTVFVVIWLLMSVIRSGADTLRKKQAFKEKPMDSYLQIIRIVLMTLGAVVIFSTLTGKSPVVFFTAMGALSAVLLLMFKDTIMGFVASIQVSANDMVRIGDWITMTKYGADGDVVQINLTTVKIQNFDKTITTIPTYSLISDSFQNWRGMHQAGGRRIKRAIHIRQSSIRFIKPEEIEEFRKIQSLTGYIDHRQRDIDKSNQRNGIDKSLLVNGRNLTNAGLFRKYIDSYLAHHSGTHKKMTLMTRQLAPTATGLPIEIYAFTSTTKWVEYEHIMADIFDHLLAAATYFDLQIFEYEGVKGLDQD
jgi:miniconductance mechanosensitive channel